LGNVTGNLPDGLTVPNRMFATASPPRIAEADELDIGDLDLLALDSVEGRDPVRG